MLKTNDNNKELDNSEDNNVLYLSEDDANALGIYEGLIQRVYVDGQEVEVVFVDEHEFIPASEQERRIYNQADELVKKYNDESLIHSHDNTNNQPSQHESIGIISDNEFNQSSKRAKLREEILNDNLQYLAENNPNESTLFDEEEVELVYTNDKK